MQSVGASVRSGYTLTPHDTNFQKMDAIWVGTGGSLVIDYGDGTSLTFANVPGGTFFETQGGIVKTTSTAANLVAVFWNSRGNS